MNLFDLTGKTAVIVGGTSTLGGSMAVGLASAMGRGKTSHGRLLLRSPYRAAVRIAMDGD